VCERERVFVCMCVCEREREIERESVCVFLGLALPEFVDRRRIQPLLLATALGSGFEG